MIKAMQPIGPGIENPCVGSSILSLATTDAASRVSTHYRLSNKPAGVEYPVVLALLLMLSFSAMASGEWVECQLAGVNSSMTARQPALFSVHNANLDPAIPMDGTWTTIDVTDLVPLDARCVRVTGILMISGGKANTCDIHIGFRRYGEGSGASRGAQTVSAARNGARTNYSRWVPLERDSGGRAVFQVRLEGFNTGGFPGYRFDLNNRYPETCALGVNGWIDAYGR